jgi:hypothetical protein
MRRFVAFLLSSALVGCDYFIGQPAQVASITIEPDTVITVPENDIRGISAVARDGNGNVMPDVQIEWSTRDYMVAGVDPFQGILYAAGPGTTIIEARAGKVVATATVTVTRGVIKTISVNPNRFVIVPGQTMQLFATPQDSQGRTLKGRAVTYTATSALASVSPFGLVTGNSPGLATITVASEGVSFDLRLRVSPTSVAFDYFKRGGTTTPGTATLTFAPQNMNRATLAIDGRIIPVFTTVNYDLGVTCLISEIPSAPEALTKCTFDSLPLAIRLCTSNVNDFSDPGRLMYVLLPANDTGRVPSTAAALLAAVQSSTIMQGIRVHTGCNPSFVIPSTGTVVPQWVRNAPDTNFYLWPNSTTVHTAASVAALLDGAAIYSAPGAGSIYTRYLAIRLSPTLFELWH